jgi:pre-mRNA-splicing factor 38A
MSHRADGSNTLDNRGYSGPLIRGQNPALLLETAMRDRITDSLYWKEQCFGLNAATFCDRAVELTYIGGTYGVAMKPTPFICLAFKLLTLVPDREIVLEYLKYGGDEWKYLRALAAFYVRLTFEPADVYKTLEPFLEDSRKLRQRRKEEYTLVHMDEFVDNLLTKDRVCGTSLWKLPARQLLEDLEQLDERVSPLQAELDAMDEDEDAVMEDHDRNGNGASEDDRSRNSYRSSRSRSRSRSSRRSRSKGRSISD